MIEIVMDGPGKNALGTEMMQSVIDRLRAAAGKPVLLTGAGDAFSAGLNLKEVAEHEEPAMLTFLQLLERCMSELYLYPGPIVAAVNGHAIAGGCVAALCCDHRVMTTNPRAKIGLNETALGVRFPPRVLAIVRRRLSPAHADRVLLGASLFNPQDALSLGLVDELADDAAAVAKSRLEMLENYPPAAYAQTKADIRGVSPADLCPDDEQDQRLRAAATYWAGPNVRGRVRAVLGR